MSLLDGLDRRRERDLQIRENAARLAQVFAVLTSTGQGTNQFDERVDFELTFVERPVISYGSYCDVEELADALGLEDADNLPLPVCTGYVIEWDQDNRDFYTGCWVAARVNFPSADQIDPTKMPTIEHHFTFSAIGMKDIPPEADDASD